MNGLKELIHWNELDLSERPSEENVFAFKAVWAV